MGTGSARTVNPESQANDRWAIHDVLVRYCRGVDRLDADLVRSAYHPDAVDEHGPYRYTGETVGSELVKRLAAHYRVTSHMILNETIELAGDRARAESYYIAAMVEASATQIDCLIHIFGRYLDQFELRLGEWRIARRIVVVDWASESRQQRPHHEHFSATAPWMGRRSTDDRSYEHWSGEAQEPKWP